MVTLSNGGVEKLDFYYKRAIGSLDDMLVNFFRKSRILSRCVECLIFLGLLNKIMFMRI